MKLDKLSYLFIALIVVISSFLIGQKNTYESELKILTNLFN